MSQSTSKDQTQLNGSMSALAKANVTSMSKAKKFCLLTGGIAISIAGLLAINSYLLSQRLQQNQQKNHLTQVKHLQESGKYDRCIHQAKDIVGSSTEIANEAEILLKACHAGEVQQLISKAQVLAGGQHFKDAINTLKTVPTDAVDYQKVQQMIDNWSNHILESAKAQYETGNLDVALTWAETIPENSPLHQTARTAISTWQKEWKVSEQHLHNAREAFKIGQWDTAIAEANQVSTEYWKQQAKPVIQQTEDEKHLLAAQTAYEAAHWQTVISEATQVTMPSAKQRATAILEQAKDELHLKNAQVALNAAQWNEAIAEAKQVKTKFEKPRAVLITAKAEDSKHLYAAWKALRLSQWDEAVVEAYQVTTDDGKQQATLIIQGANNGKQLARAQEALRTTQRELAITKSAQLNTDLATQQAKQLFGDANTKQQVCASQNTTTLSQVNELKVSFTQENASTNREPRAVLAPKHQTAQPAGTVKPLLFSEGMLSPSTAICQNGGLYQVHRFSGNLGQSVTIRLESQDFKTHLLLIDPDGKVIPSRTDLSSKPSFIFTLPQTGIYLILAGASESTGQGRYVLTAR